MRRAWLLALVVAVAACGKPSGAWVVAKAPPLAYDTAPAVALLPDRSVLIAGGGYFGAAVPNVYRYLPGSDQWLSVGALPAAREQAASAPLPGGRFLVAGGLASTASTPVFIGSADISGPDGSWQEVPLPTALAAMTAVPLADGRVLLAGGFGAAGPSAAAWLFDPRERMFHVLHSMPVVAEQPAGARLPDGRILLVAARTSAIFDPATGAWTVGPPPPESQQQVTVALPSGTVLLLTTQFERAGPLTTCELWTPGTAAWRFAACVTERFIPTTLLPAGGMVELVSFDAVTATSNVSSYDPRQDTWTTGPPLGSGRSPVAAAPLSGNRVLVLGPDAYAVYDPRADLHPAIGGSLAAPTVTLWEGGIVLLLLLLLALRWWRSAAQSASGGLGEAG